jgi:hypothetical protein
MWVFYFVSAQLLSRMLDITNLYYIVTLLRVDRQMMEEYLNIIRVEGIKPPLMLDLNLR